MVSGSGVEGGAAAAPDRDTVAPGQQPPPSPALLCARGPVKHLVAFQTLGLNYRCRKPSKAEVKKAWHQLSMRLHPDRHAARDGLAT